MVSVSKHPTTDVQVKITKFQLFPIADIEMKISIREIIIFMLKRNLNCHLILVEPEKILSISD